MKKYFLLLGLFVGMASMLYAAAPAYNEWVSYLGASTVIDSQHTASQWELLDSILVTKTDTCYTQYTLSGTAALNEGDKLYIGFSNTDAYTIVDTTIISGIGYGGTGAKAKVPFTAYYFDSLISQTDAIDSIWWFAAVSGSAGSEKVEILDGVIKVEIFDFNAAGVEDE